MASKEEALSKKIDRVKKSIEQFPAAASSLNSATSQLGQSIGQLDATLKKFSIGIPTWVSFNGSPDTEPGYYHEDLGYAKIAGRWGIAVRTVLGDVRSDEGDRVEQWLFPDAPRFLAVQAIEKIPELLEALLKNAGDLSKKIAEKAEEVDLLAEGINSVINPPSKPKAPNNTYAQAKKHAEEGQGVSDAAMAFSNTALSEATATAEAATAGASSSNDLLARYVRYAGVDVSAALTPPASASNAIAEFIVGAGAPGTPIVTKARK